MTNFKALMMFFAGITLIIAATYISKESNGAVLAVIIMVVVVPMVLIGAKQLEIEAKEQEAKAAEQEVKAREQEAKAKKQEAKAREREEYAKEQEEYAKEQAAKAKELEAKAEELEAKAKTAIDDLSKNALVTGFAQLKDGQFIEDDIIDLMRVLQRKGVQTDINQTRAALIQALRAAKYTVFLQRLDTCNPNSFDEYLMAYAQCGYSHDDEEHTSMLFKTLELRLPDFGLRFDAVRERLLHIIEDQRLERIERDIILGRASPSMEQIDKMSGVEFERLISDLFCRMGYTVKLTKASGDGGADIICDKLRGRCVIQAKRSAGSVGLNAIQEIYAAKRLYDADEATVVTNNMFTAAAIKLAQVNSVELVDRTKLQTLLRNLF